MGKEKIRNSETAQKTCWTGSHRAVPQYRWKWWKRWGNKFLRRMHKKDLLEGSE